MTQKPLLRKGVVRVRLCGQHGWRKVNEALLGKIGCVVIVKNEERHIAEWLAWQFFIGFDCVFLFDNESTDQTRAIAAGFAPRYDVRVLDWPGSGPGFQGRAYEHAAGLLKDEFEWLAFFDADEFLVLDEGLDLKGLLAQRQEAAIGIPWALFGSSGHKDYPRGLVIEAFSRRAPASFPPNAHIKSIVRPRVLKRAFNPHAFEIEGEYVDIVGRPLAFKQPGVLAQTVEYDGAKLHHYFTRSWAHWQARLARGNLGTPRTEQDFHDYDRNEIHDDSAARHASEIRALLAALPPAEKHAYAICACARWETPYVVEWLNYYREIGFSHVYLYCNDDDPGALYQRMLPFTQGEAPFVTFYHHPHQGQQFEMYAHFLRHALAETEWVAFFDIDEFLRLPPGEKIGEFLRRFSPDVECVMFNWVFFGPNGHKTPPEGLVLENFTRRNAMLNPFTKFVARSRTMEELNLTDRGRAHGFWHEIGSKVDRPVATVNALGEDMAEYYQGFPDSSREFANVPARRERLLETAVIHHYAFRSEQAYAERSARGLKGDFGGQGAWKKVADGPGFAGHLATVNGVEDTRLAGFWAERRRRAWDFGTGLPELPQAPTRPDSISRGKRAMQSSHCEWSFAPTPEQDAAGAVNGVLDGTRKFHTDLEDNPWWQVDLGGIATITEIHVHNTRDHAQDRFRDFSLSVSIDGSSWVELAEKRDDVPLAEPYIWAGPGTAWARYVRVTLLGRNYLHLDQVEVFGRLP